MSTDALPPGWCWTTIGEIGEVRLGRQRSPKNRSNKHPTRYIRAANITWTGLDLSDVLDMEFRPEELATYRLATGDVLLSEASGSATEVGKPAIWNGEIDDCCFQNTVIRFRPRGIPPGFPFVVFTHFARNGVFAAASKGVGIHHLSADRFLQLRIPVPPVNEQRRISDRVDELFTDLAAGVAALERVRRNLARYRSAVLHAAVTGRLTAAWRAQQRPVEEPASKLLDRILAERRRQWEQRTLAKYAAAGREPPKNWRDRYPEPLPPNTHGLLELPAGWCWATQDQIGEVQLGRQRSPEHHTGEHMRPYLRVANVYENRIDTSDVLRMNFTPQEYVTYALRPGDILLNEGQSMELVGRPAMYGGEVAGSCFQNTLVRQRVFEGVVPDYALIAIRAQFRAGRYRQIARITTSIAHLGAERFATVEFPLPPLAEQAFIVETVSEKLSQIDALEAEVKRGLARATRLRQAILKAAFEGKLVPQDPGDERAAALLARLKAARAADAANEDSGDEPARRPKRRRPKLSMPTNTDGSTLFDGVASADSPRRPRRKSKR
jgi:type I restriction enzyme S subunit